VAEAWAAWRRRRARERRMADVFAEIVCRDTPAGAGAGASVSAKERRAGEERKRAVVELFLRRRVE
jgi:hypothetical protein